MSKEQEYFQKLKSKKWRMNSGVLYTIKTKNKNAVPFKPNLPQQHFQKNKKNRNIILKARQLGMTTGQIIDMFDNTLFNKNYNALFIAHERDPAIEIFDEKVMFAWNNFPLKHLYDPDTQRAGKLKVGFFDGTRRGKKQTSKSFSSLQVALSGRSGTFHQLHISELAKMAAKYPAKAKEIITGTIPTVPLDGEVTIESTAEGDSGLFHDMFMEAYSRNPDIPKRPTEFQPFFYNWQWDLAEIKKIENVDPQIPQEFRDFQLEHNEKALYNQTLIPINDIALTYYYYKWLSLNKNWHALKQEYPTYPEEAFITSGHTIFPQEQLLKLEQHTHKPIEIQGEWAIYEQPNSTHNYIIGADPSEGVSRDSSAAVVIDISTPDHRPKVVAEFCNNYTDPVQFAHELKLAGKYFRNALIAVERNNHGHATLVELTKIYPEDSIFKKQKEDEYDNNETQKLGWQTNRGNKTDLIYNLINLIRDNGIAIPSQTIINEMKSYQREALHTIQAKEDQSRHWDRVMALAIACKVSQFDDRNTLVYTRLDDTHFDPYAAI